MSAAHHFIFLSDPRTQRVIGEPKVSNHGVIRLSEATGMHVHTVSPLPLRPPRAFQPHASASASSPRSLARRHDRRRRPDPHERPR